MIKGVYKKPPSDPYENRYIPPWKVKRPKKNPNYHNPIITQKNPVKGKQSTTEGTQPPQGNLEAIHVMKTIAKSIGLVSLAAIAIVFGLIFLKFLDVGSVGSALDKIVSDVGNLVPNIIKNDVSDSQNIGSNKCSRTSEDCCKWRNFGDGIPPAQTAAISVLEPCDCPENTYDETGRTHYIPDEKGNMLATRLCTCRDCPGH